MTTKTNKSDETLRLEYAFEKGINFKDRIIQITGEIEDQNSFDYLDAGLTEMETKSKSSIKLKINSPGGSVYEALAMVGRIEDSKAHIVTECYGHAMSAAGLILASGDKRRMSRRAWFMIHEISAGVVGTVTQMEEEVLQIKREMEAWSDAMADFTKKSKKFWWDLAQKKNAYLTAEECLKYGIVDELF